MAEKVPRFPRLCLPACSFSYGNDLFVGFRDSVIAFVLLYWRKWIVIFRLELIPWGGVDADPGRGISVPGVVTEYCFKTCAFQRQLFVK